MVWITCIYCQKWQIKRLTWLDTNFSKSLKANVNLKFSILKLFQLIVFNLKEDWYFCCYSWLSKNSSQNSFELNFFLKWCCKISIMQFYKLFKKIIWKDIHILQDDCINKALPFAKISPWVCWWIWIFLSFLRKVHVIQICSEWNTVH